MGAGADGTRPNANNSVFSVPADDTGGAAYMERRLRHVPDLWAPSGKTLLTLNLQVGCRKLSAMGVEKLIADLCVQRPKGRVMHLSGTKPTCHLGVSPLYPQ